MRVLSLTLDLELSEFRKYVITAAGHEVTSITSEKEATSATQNGENYGVAFVCHRFPAAAARQFIRLLRQQHSDTKVVYIVRMYGEWPEVEADRYIAGADGPKALLRVLEELGAKPTSETKIGTSKSAELC
jgi:DNA-binding response OmpR family regulator